MKLLPVLAAFLGPLAAGFAQEAPPRERVEKFMAAGRASEVNESANAYGQEVIETLTALLLSDPAEAQRYFLKARAQVAAERAAKGTSKPGEGGDWQRSVSSLGAAMGGALLRVEKEMKPGDERLPKIVSVVTAMLASDEGCGVEGNVTTGTYLGWLMLKAGREGEGKFSAQRMIEKLGPDVKLEQLPLWIGLARGIGWDYLRNDTEQKDWLRKYAAEGKHRELAQLLLTGTTISMQEKDAANKPRAGILDRAQLPEEQLWLVNLLEKKTIPPAILADSAAQVLRVWPTAEPPLRCVCAHALAAAWEKDVPVNSVEAAWIVESMSQLLKDGKAPGDAGFSTAVRALLSAWEKRMELNRTPLFGWRAEELTAPSLAGLMHLLARSQGSEAADKFLTLCIGEAARDASLWTDLKLSESLQRARLFAEAAKVIASITTEQESHAEVSDDRRMHVAIKRYQLPLNAAAATGSAEAVKATIAMLKEKPDDATAWTGAAWSWYEMAQSLREEGKQEEALRHYSVSSVLANAAMRMARSTHAQYQPPSDGNCREILKALKFDPDQVGVLRLVAGVDILLDSFDGAWKEMPEAVRKRMIKGLPAK